ncbi:MAG TPA: hypothetical protein DCM86_15005 [Verrucomicrobiales bacterium]|nr:hypothetical protein [Verrucomicrobiales bacterium]
MTTLPTPSAPLGIECGGTRTTALMPRVGGRGAISWEGGPGNLRLLRDRDLVRLFEEIAAAFPSPTALGIGMAGLRTREDRERVERAVARCWPGVSLRLVNDLETALAAAPTVRLPSGGEPRVRVLVLSGTGSCCLGVTASGRQLKIGGWGHILGDKGSAHEIGLRALKAVVYYLDRDREWTRLGTRILRRLLLNEPNDLIPWVQGASKDQVASLAIEVFEAARAGDRIAKDILSGAAASLAKDAIACARRLARPGEPVQFVLAGSVLLRQPGFARNVARQLRAEWPTARVTPLRQPSVAGAVALAGHLGTQAPQVSPPRRVGGRPNIARRQEPLALLPVATAPSPTEQRHPGSLTLDRMSLPSAVALFLEEDARVPGAILREKRGIVQAIGWISTSLRKGGRLFYIGAGTSGRLGVLDASECPPTFRTDPAHVQGIMAGGQRALWESVEGAEDDMEAGGRAVGFRGVGPRDVVVGIAASGRTPFVWGGLAEARRRGARTVIVSCNPHLRFQRGQRPDGVIAVDLGPELLTGSTRLKAGTATKLILNLLTTLSMVRLGKVASNLMIDLNPSNRKLRDRAVRIVCQLSGVGEPVARRALERSGWRVRQAWESVRRRRQ